MPKRASSKSSKTTSTITADGLAQGADLEAARALAWSLHTVQARAANKDVSSEDINASFVDNREELIKQSRLVLRFLHTRGYTVSKADA